MPLTVPPPDVPKPPPIASVLPLIPLLGASRVTTPLLLPMPPQGPLADAWFVVPANCSTIDADAGAVHAESASCSSAMPSPEVSGAGKAVLRYQFTGVPESASVQRNP